MSPIDRSDLNGEREKEIRESDEKASVQCEGKRGDSAIYRGLGRTSRVVVP